MSTMNWLIFEWVTRPFVSNIGHRKNLGQVSVAKPLRFSTSSQEKRPVETKNQHRWQCQLYRNPFTVVNVEITLMHWMGARQDQSVATMLDTAHCVKNLMVPQLLMLRVNRPKDRALGPKGIYPHRNIEGNEPGWLVCMIDNGALLQ